MSFQSPLRELSSSGWSPSSKTSLSRGRSQEATPIYRRGNSDVPTPGDEADLAGEVASVRRELETSRRQQQLLESNNLQLTEQFKTAQRMQQAARVSEESALSDLADELLKIKKVREQGAARERRSQIL